MVTYVRNRVSCAVLIVLFYDLLQKVAVEAIVHSASKKDKCTGLLGGAVPILKKLYHEGADDAIKVRALVVRIHGLNVLMLYSYSC